MLIEPYDDGVVVRFGNVQSSVSVLIGPITANSNYSYFSSGDWITIVIKNSKPTNILSRDIPG